MLFSKVRYFSCGRVRSNGALERACRILVEAASKGMI